MKYTLPLLSLFAIPCLAVAQTEDDFNSGMLVERDYTTGNHTVSWYGIQNHAYMIMTSVDLINWTYINNIFVGEDAIEDSFNFTLSGGSDKAFFKLQYTDHGVASPLTGDYDGDGISNQTELDNGTDPFSSIDFNANGIPDDADALWASVPSQWINDIVTDANSAYYDPDNLIAAVGDVSPVDDYDGDGLSNLQEYLTGTDATDFFNGSTSATLRIVGAEGVNVAPSTYLEPMITVMVENSIGKRMANAPIRFSTVSGHLGLTKIAEPGATLSSYLVIRSSLAGAEVAYFAPSSTGSNEILVSLPTGQTLTATVHVVSPASKAKSPIRDISTVQHGNGDMTYTWTSDADDGDWFQIEDKMRDGTYQPIFQTTYGSPELPYVNGQNTYSLTLDFNNQPVAP